MLFIHLGAWQITARLNEVEPEAQFAEARPAAHLVFPPRARSGKARAGRGGACPDKAFNRLLSAVRLIFIFSYPFFHLYFKHFLKFLK
jgi:hypothetical protein